MMIVTCPLCGIPVALGGLGDTEEVEVTIRRDDGESAARTFMTVGGRAEQLVHTCDEDASTWPSRHDSVRVLGHDAVTTAPNVTLMRLADAIRLLESVGLAWEVHVADRIERTVKDDDIVYAQSPAAGPLVPLGTSVRLTVRALDR